MAAISWISTVGGDWSDGSNWQGGVVPGVTDDAVIEVSTAETITISAPVIVHSADIEDPAGTLNITASGLLTAVTDVRLAITFFVTGGQIDAGGVVTIVEPGGTIDVIQPCFVAGTRLATPLGERLVESVAPGDALTLAAGGNRTVRWVGRRHVDCRRHPAPRSVWPVRVPHGAFGGGLPRRDLVLSPDHAVFVGAGLIPVRLLVDNVAIVQEPWDAVTYFHVELETHDVILAEGLPVESYLDTGNRTAFEAGGRVARPYLGSAAEVREARACAPLVLEGAELARARARLAGYARGRVPRCA